MFSTPLLLSRRLPNLGFTSYAEYLASDHWKDFRSRYLLSPSTPKRCLVCKSDLITLHHVTYGTLGEELFEDVIPLCWPHHDAVHKCLKRHNLPLEDSYWVIRTLKGNNGGRKAQKVRVKSKNRCRRGTPEQQEKKLIGRCYDIRRRLSQLRKLSGSNAPLFFGIEDLVDTRNICTLGKRLALATARYGNLLTPAACKVNMKVVRKTRGYKVQPSVT